MRLNSRLRKSLRAAGFMFVLSLVLITCVSALHLATAKRVARNADLFLQRAILAVAGMPVPDAPADVAELFRSTVSANPDGGADCFQVRAPGTGALRAVVFRRQARGLWGAIHAVVGVDPAERTFLEIRVLEHNETPGLGARIEEPWFLRQTAGKSGPFVLKPEGTRSAAPTEIDAITGATITSGAIRDLLNGVRREATEAIP